MRFLGYFFTMLIAILPMLWIDNYNLDNSVWWTVNVVWFLGRLFGYFEQGE